MTRFAETELTLQETREGELYLAGERVPAGVYRLVGTNREIVLDREDFLPGSLDGRVACYQSAPLCWKQMQEQPQVMKGSDDVP